MPLNGCNYSFRLVTLLARATGLCGVEFVLARLGCDAWHYAAAGAGVGGRGGGQAPGRRHQAAAAQQAKAVKAHGGEENEPATDQWVQCSKCQVWRQVPDEFWPEIANADEDEDWMCKVRVKGRGLE